MHLSLCMSRIQYWRLLSEQFVELMPNSKKSPIGSIGLYYANELENDVLVRRPLGIDSGRTAPTDETGNSVKLLELEL